MVKSNNGGAWPYHLYNGTKPELQGSYVKCATNPCRMHQPSEHIMATSPEDAYAQAHQNDSYGFGANTANNNNPKIKEEIEYLALKGYTPELYYANSNLDTETKLELVRPGDEIMDKHGLTYRLIAGYPTGTMNAVCINDGSVKKFDDIRDTIEDVTFRNNAARARAAGEHSNMIHITGGSSEYLDEIKYDEDNDRNIDLGAFDYPKDSPYSCLLNIDGKEYYIRKMHRGEEDEDVDFDSDKDERGGGCYELMPMNSAATRRTYGNNITISGNALKRKLNNKDSNWEYTMYSTEKESDYNLESRYLNTQTAISNIRHEFVEVNKQIKDLEIKSKQASVFGLKLNAIKNKSRKLKKRLNQLSKISYAIIPDEKDIEKWIMKEVFE